MIESEKDWWLAADILKTEYRKIIAAKERKLRRDPNHADSAVLRKDIEETKRDLARLSEHYTDELTQRVVRSRTNASGEVEFVDPQSIMKLFRKA